MFKFVRSLSFFWPVKVLEPHPDNAGQLIERSFDAEFVLMDEQEAKASADARSAIIAKFTADMDEATTKAVQAELEAHDRVALLNVLRGWRDIEDENGAPIPFDTQTFNAVYAHRRVRSALLRAYGEAISEDKARLGN